jgi:hypothetical protein
MALIHASDWPPERAVEEDARRSEGTARNRAAHGGGGVSAAEHPDELPPQRKKHLEQEARQRHRLRARGAC